MSRGAPLDRPSPVRRWLFRLPLRLGALGRAVERLYARLVGVEWIALDTVGRRSGRVHTVILDVVGRDPLRDVYYVQPAYGRRADWVRNVVVNPAVAVRVGERRASARVREATGAEGAEVVLRFIRAHPRYARLILRFVPYVADVARPDAEVRRDLLATTVFAIEVERSAPRTERGLPGAASVASRLSPVADRVSSPTSDRR